MTVICLTNCPMKLRGDLTKWLMEVNTGVYVGNISARVREELWERITQNIRSGQATMVYRASGEQHMDFRIHNTSWKPVDYDGLKLILRPNPCADTPDEQTPLAEGFSKASRMRSVRKLQLTSSKAKEAGSYTVIDLETTGLNYNRDEIIEIGALRVRNGIPMEEFQCLVRGNTMIPDAVQTLTGLKDADFTDACSLTTALKDLLLFLGTDTLLCWNAAFDIAFLQIGCNRCGLPIPKNKIEDAQKLARKNAIDSRLVTAAEYFGIDTKAAHRALPDCYLTHAVYGKLNETSAENKEKT